MTRTQSRVLFILASIIVVAGVGYFALKTDTPEEKKQDRGVIEKRTVVDDSQGQDALTKVMIKAEKRNFSLEQQDGDWFYLEGDTKILAKQQKLASLVKAMKRAPISKRFEESEIPDAKETGLDNPVVVVKLYSGDKVLSELAMGKISAFNKQLYARLGDVTLMTEGSVMRAANARLEQWIEDKLLGIHPDDIETMEVLLRPGVTHPQGSKKSPPTSFEITRSDVSVELKGVKVKRGFVLKSPVVEGFDAETMRAIVNVVSGVGVALTEEPEHLAALKEKPAMATLKVKTKTQEYEVALSDPITMGDDQIVVVKRSCDSTYFRTHRSVMDFILKSKEDLITNRVTLLEAPSIYSIDLKSPLTGAVSLERTPQGLGVDAGWKMTAPQEFKADPRVVNSMILALSALRGNSRVEGDPADPQVLTRFGLDEENARQVTFKVRNGQALATLYLGKDKGDQVYAMRKNSGFIALVDNAQVKLFPKSLDALKFRER